MFPKKDPLINYYPIAFNFDYVQISFSLNSFDLYEDREMMSCMKLGQELITNTHWNKFISACQVAQFQLLSWYHCLINYFISSSVRIFNASLLPLVHMTLSVAFPQI